MQLAQRTMGSGLILNLTPLVLRSTQTFVPKIVLLASSQTMWHTLMEDMGSAFSTNLFQDKTLACPLLKIRPDQMILIGRIHLYLRCSRISQATRTEEMVPLHWTLEQSDSKISRFRTTYSQESRLN